MTNLSTLSGGTKQQEMNPREGFVARRKNKREIREGGVRVIRMHYIQARNGQRISLIYNKHDMYHDDVYNLKI